MDVTILKKLRDKRLGTAASNILKVHRKIIGKYNVKRRGRPVLKESIKQLVYQFYKSEKISRERPEKRFKGKRLMTLPKKTQNLVYYHYSLLLS